jgi:sterol desaturase/sphingolipid hydroxylase (fatty acid hydroxylase superfamily)
MEQFISSHRLLFLLPGVVLTVLLEAYFYQKRFARAYPWRDTLTSFWVGVGHQVTGLANKVLVVGLMGGYVWDHRVNTIESSWWTMGLLFIALEFAYYWYHRASHEVNVMWATHSTHHSPNEMVFASAVRLGWTPFLSFSWMFFLPLVWIGFTTTEVFGMLSLNLVYQFLVHTRLIGKLGFIEGILNTPSAHRVHHASNEEYLDKNYGGVLMIYDRLFGTYAPERDDIEIRYGLVHPIQSQNLLQVVFERWFTLIAQFIQRPGLKEKLHVLLAKPGNVG